MMYEMSLKEIEKACRGKLIIPEGKGTGEEQIQAAVIDSRLVEEGALFLAAPGERVDGHRFIGAAFEKGALCVVTEKEPFRVREEYGIKEESWGPYILVENTLKALQDIAGAYRSLMEIPVVGITGSVGKTSTKEIIAGVLQEKYNVLKTQGNFNNEIGLPLTLLRIGREHEAAVVEMGISDFGEMRRLSRMAKPLICVITNIGQSHLETLKSREGILKAKSEIFEYMQPEGEVCLNGDDDMLSTLTSVNGKAPHFFGIGKGGKKEIYADGIESLGLFGSDVCLHFLREGKEEKFTAHVPLPGEHMVLNAAAASCVGLLLGLTPKQIQEGISRVKPVGGRSNLIPLSRYTLVDDCYNANPVSMKAAIDLLKMAKGKKIAILGDMFDLGENSDKMHREVGAYAAASGLDGLICIGENARHIYEAAKEWYLEKSASKEEGQEEVRRPESKLIYYKTKEDFFAKQGKGLEEFGEKFGEELGEGSGEGSGEDSGEGSGEGKGEKPTILIKASHGMEFNKIVKNMVELRVR